MENTTVEERKTLIKDTIQEYNLPENLNIDEALLSYPKFPKKVSITLAFIILAYKREVLSTELSKLSTQPAALIRQLRKDGFIFQQTGKNYEYRNENGERSRKIIGLQSETKSDKEDVNSIPNIYIDRIHIQNFFCIKDLKIENLSAQKEIYILGENGDGKSLILQAIILGLKSYFINNKAKKGGEQGVGNLIDLLDANKGLTIEIEDSKQYSFNLKSKEYVENIFAYGVHRSRKNNKISELYGFGSLFSDEVYLKDPSDWLLNLERLNLKEEPSLSVQHAIKMLQELLVHNVKIELGKNVIYRERGYEIGFNQLSEGYKSVINWVVDLLSRLSENQPNTQKIQEFEGIVIVDEISTHLHPKWEYSIVRKLRNWFPKIQFIFTTHSPITVMGASDDAIFYRIYREQEGEESNTKISEPFQESEINNWMANILITSPLFDLENARMSAFSEEKDLDTSQSFTYHLIHQEISERVKQLKTEGKRYISPERMKEMIQNAIDQHQANN